MRSFSDANAKGTYAYVGGPLEGAFPGDGLTSGMPGYSIRSMALDGAQEHGGGGRGGLLGACRCFGAVISIGILLFTGCVYNLAYLLTILPMLGKEQLIVPFALLFNVPWLLALASYLQANMSDPGSVPEGWYRFVQSTGAALPVFEAAHTWQHGRATVTPQSNMPRPERSHYCKVSNQVVLRMDHYCPWINNCVGIGNHKFFLLLIIYAILASVAGLLTSLPELVYIAFHFLGRDGRSWQIQMVNGRITWEKVDFALLTEESLLLLAAAGLGALITVLLSILLFEHLPNTLHGVTTIEAHYGKDSNPYDLGGYIANMSQVFGDFGLDWFLPISPLRPTSDGIVFPPLNDCFQYYGRGPPPSQPEDFWRARYGVRPPMQQLLSASHGKPVSGGPLDWLSSLWD